MISCRYETKCEPVMEKKCTTNTEAQCEVVNETECETVQDEVCEDVLERKCNVVNDRRCFNVPKQECSVSIICLVYNTLDYKLSCFRLFPTANVPLCTPPSVTML